MYAIAVVVFMIFIVSDNNLIVCESDLKLLCIN